MRQCIIWLGRRIETTQITIIENQKQSWQSFIHIWSLNFQSSMCKIKNQSQKNKEIKIETEQNKQNEDKIESKKLIH